MTFALRGASAPCCPSRPRGRGWGVAAFAPGGGRPWEPQSHAHGPLGPSMPLPTAEPRRREAGGVHGRTPPSPEGETDRVCAVIRWGSQGREGAEARPPSSGCSRVVPLCPGQTHTHSGEVQRGQLLFSVAGVPGTVLIVMEISAYLP